MPDKNTQMKTYETVAGGLLIAVGAFSLFVQFDFVGFISAALTIAAGIVVLRRIWRLFATIVCGIGVARFLLMLPGGIGVARYGVLTYLLYALLSLAVYGLAVGLLIRPRETVPLPRVQRPAKLDDSNTPSSSAPAFSRSASTRSIRCSAERLRCTPLLACST